MSAKTTRSRFSAGTLTAGLILLMVLALGSCKDDDENYLEGSITSAYNMSFDNVRVRLYPDSGLSIEYVKKSGPGEKVPLRLTIDQTELQLASGTEYPIKTTGSISRGVGFDSMPLPELDSGKIRLNSFAPTHGSGVSGDFEAVFKGTDDKRMNLNGAFSASLDRVD